MPINLVNNKVLSEYLSDIVYQGEQYPSSFAENFQKTKVIFTDFEEYEKNKDNVVKNMINQYFQHRLRLYLTDKTDAAYLHPLYDGKNFPAWVAKALSEGCSVYEFIPADVPSKLHDDIIGLRDFLYNSARRYVEKTADSAKQSGGKIKLRQDFLKSHNEYTDVEQTLLQAKKYHDILAYKVSKRHKDAQMHKKSSDGVVSVMDFGNGMQIVRLTTKQALDFESEYMGHCVGEGTYDQGLATGDIEIYSLRDAQGGPHVTFEIRNNNIHQCKGKGNKAPMERYRPYVKNFVIQRRFGLKEDKANVGLILQNNRYYDVFKLPQGFVVEGDLDLSGLNLMILPDLSSVTVKGSFKCADNHLKTLFGAPQIVAENFDCSGNSLKNLENAPHTVGGNFFCGNNQLESLKGAPHTIGKSFYCSGNRLTDLIYAPQIIGGGFYCNGNKLISLRGAPQIIKGNFCCDHNNLITLTGAPQMVFGDFSCNNNRLQNLKGAPAMVRGNFECRKNWLTTLENAPRSVGQDFQCAENMLTSLEGAPNRIYGKFDCGYNFLDKRSKVPFRVLLYHEIIGAQKEELRQMFEDNSMTRIQPINFDGVSSKEFKAMCKKELECSNAVKNYIHYSAKPTSAMFIKKDKTDNQRQQNADGQKQKFAALSSKGNKKRPLPINNGFRSLSR